MEGKAMTSGEYVHVLATLAMQPRSQAKNWAAACRTENDDGVHGKGAARQPERPALSENLRAV
jgi:hypothetical protein